jgi:protocatechuate 3,4-dioxygenase beta subunit
LTSTPADAVSGLAAHVFKLKSHICPTTIIFVTICFFKIPLSPPQNPAHKHLTTQINLNGDRYLWDDFAFATRDKLIATPVKITDSALAAKRNLPDPHTEAQFDFTLIFKLSELSLNVSFDLKV